MQPLQQSTPVCCIILMDDIRNDVTINKTGALVWGRKRLQYIVLKKSFFRNVLDMEPLDNNGKK